MGKELLLLRHAKSSWGDATVSDRERRLNNRGRRNAPMMGRALSELLQPQCVHVSPATRAQLTLGGLQDGWPGLQAMQHVTEEALYTFAMDDIVDWLKGSGQQADSLFLIGHNPALTELTNWLCGDVVLTRLPTAGFVHLSLDIADWAALRPACARLVQRIFPRQLQDA